MMWVIIISAIIIGFIILGWYLLIETEGVYVGRGMVIWLYDVYATRYDAIKEVDDISEHLYLAQPIMRQIPFNDPMVLDVATGTGRMPLALCQHASFEGHIIALELSRKMLEQAVKRIQTEHFMDYVTFLHGSAEKLPFDDGAFDLVTCMEAIEFTPHPLGTLSELMRVLRHGGLMVMTNRINVMMPQRLWARDELQHYLEQLGAESVHIHAWQSNYDLVWVRKAGNSDPIRQRMLESILKCTRCDGLFRYANDVMVCEQCGEKITVADHIIHYAKHQMQGR